MAFSWIATPPDTPDPSEAKRQSKPKPNGKSRYKVRFKVFNPDGASSEEQLRGIAKRKDWKISKRRPSPPNESIQLQTNPQRLLHNDEKRSEDEEIPSPITRLPHNGTRQDPFTVLPIKGECVRQSLDYFLSVVLPEHNGYNVEGHPNPHVSLLLPYAIDHAVLFESIIALCRASLVLAMGKDPTQDKALIQHRKETMVGVTKRLSTADAVNDATLLSVTMLLTLEYLLGNVAGVSAHLSGLERMLSMRKDLDNEDPWTQFVKTGVDAYKMLGSFVTGKPPVLPKNSPSYIEETFTELSLDRPVVYPTLPFSSDLCIIISRLPSGFSELSLSGMLSEQMLHVLASILGTTAVTLNATSHESILDPELQAMLSALQRISLMNVTRTEICLTAGLMAYCFQLRGLRALNLFHDPAIRHFIQVLTYHEKPDSIREQKCLMWITMAVAGALGLRTVRMPGSHLVLDRAFELYPAYQSWASLEPILRTFFWTKTIGAHWHTCWQRGKLRWDHVIRARQSKPVVVPILSHESSPQTEADTEPDESPSLQQLSLHSKAGVATTVGLVKASRCPFIGKVDTADWNADQLAAASLFHTW